MDETHDSKPHVQVQGAEHSKHEAAVGSPTAKAEGLSIWFFCGILTLGYGLVLVIQGLLERFEIFGQHAPHTVLANLQPTLWWGILLGLFGAFYTVRFRPGRG